MAWPPYRPRSLFLPKRSDDMKKATVKTGLKIALISGGLFALVPTVYGQAIGSQTLERLTVGTPQQLDRGEQVFEMQCADCHGEQGQGGADIGERMGAVGFVGEDVERSGLFSIYSVISHGIEDADHPVYDGLRYQDRWAVSHYVHDLIDDPNPDPSEVIERVRIEAIEGVCDPAIRENIADLTTPEDDEQLALGADIYATQCVACHGADGLAEVPGGQATDPPARNFTDDPENWTNGTSPLALYTTLDEGIQGTGMASYSHLPEEELWALVHYMLDEFIPEENHDDLTDDQLDDVCRSLSAPPRPDAIPLERALQFVAAEEDERRYLRYHDYGDPLVHQDADIDRGAELFGQSCASCHGADGNPEAAHGPYGKFPPFLHIEPAPLVPAAVGGTYEDVAQRVIAGPHAPLPDGPNVATFLESDWQALQFYISTFEGMGHDRVRPAGADDDIIYSVDDLELRSTADSESREVLNRWFEEQSPSTDELESWRQELDLDFDDINEEDLEALNDHLQDSD